MDGGTRRGRPTTAVAWLLLAVIAVLTGLATASALSRAGDALRLHGALAPLEADASQLVVQAAADLPPPALVGALVDRHRDVVRSPEVDVLGRGDLDALSRSLDALATATAGGESVAATASATAYRAAVQELRATLVMTARGATDAARTRILVGGVALLAAAVGGWAVRRRTALTTTAAAQRLLAPRAAAPASRVDALTGVATRNVFRERLVLAVAGAQRTGRSVAVLFLDLDGFKQLNDDHGHDVGDRVLMQVARRLDGVARRTDLLARHGGDEFTLLVEHLDGRGAVVAVAEKLLAAIRPPIHLDGMELAVGLSIGIALYPEDGANPDDLLRLADAAMYTAKRAGGSTYRFATAELREADAERAATVDGLRRALADGRLALRYQAQHDLGSGNVVGVEALLRWVLDDGTHVPAAKFIDLTEHTELARTLGSWVFEAALGQLAAWRRDGITDLRLAINMGPRFLKHPETTRLLAALIEQHGLDPATVEVEVPEDLLVADRERVGEAVRGLASIGVRVVLDDVGRDVTPLGALGALPIAAVKLSPELLKQSGRERDVLVGAVALARSLGLEVTLPHVEQVGELTEAKALGVSRAQGYLLSEAMAADEVAAVVRRQATTGSPR